MGYGSWVNLIQRAEPSRVSDGYGHMKHTGAIMTYTHRDLALQVVYLKGKF
jgi:hypothetical protein